MAAARAQLSQRVVTSERLGSAGASGNKVERVRLDDGTELIRKRVSPEWDWISRATSDQGRALSMWTRGLFERIPSAIDHTTVAVEADNGGWSIFMHDVSDALVGPDEVVDRASVRRVLAALAEVHTRSGASASPASARLKIGTTCSHRVPQSVSWSEDIRSARPSTGAGKRSQSSFPTTSPGPSSHWPTRLAFWRSSSTAGQTLIHGDVRLSNLGVPDDRIVRSGRAWRPRPLSWRRF